MRKIAIMLILLQVSLVAHKKVIIDCDPGGDDALALLLAIKSNQLDIRAITTVAGNAPLQDTTANAIYILNMVENTSIPVYAGADISLSKQKPSSDHFFGPHGLCAIHIQELLRDADTDTPAMRTRKSILRNRIQDALSHNAVDELLAIVRQYPHEISLIALGPLTNIAQAIKKDPRTMKLVKEIIVTGGAISAPGNINKDSEFNFFIDSEAVHIVFGTTIKIIMVASDTVYETDYLWQDCMHDLGDTSLLLHDPLTGAYISVKKLLTNMLSCPQGSTILKTPVYDPLSIYTIINAQAIHYEPLHRKLSSLIHADHNPDAKRAIKDLSKHGHSRTKRVKVASQISKKSFSTFLTNILTRQ